MNLGYTIQIDQCGLTTCNSFLVGRNKGTDPEDEIRQTKPKDRSRGQNWRSNQTRLPEPNRKAVPDRTANDGTGMRTRPDADRTAPKPEPDRTDRTGIEPEQRRNRTRTTKKLAKVETDGSCTGRTLRTIGSWS